MNYNIRKTGYNFICKLLSLYIILVIIILYTGTALEPNRHFSQILGCHGNPGCPLDKSSYNVTLDQLEFQQVQLQNGLQQCLPKIVYCSYFCRMNSSCLSFSYTKESKLCQLFYFFPFKIVELKGCVSFDVSFSSLFNFSVFYIK